MCPEFDSSFANLAPEEKKRRLFLNQKALLDTFLATGAIDRRQYDKSLGCLRDKMGYKDLPDDDKAVRIGE